MKIYYSFALHANIWNAHFIYSYTYLLLHLPYQAVSIRSYDLFSKNL
jgi:hypothetical protein